MPFWRDKNHRHSKSGKPERMEREVNGQDFDEHLWDQVTDIASGQHIKDFSATCDGPACGAWLFGSWVQGSRGCYCSNKCMRNAGDSN